MDPSIIGANTAISGSGLFEAIETLRELKFQTIEIHPMGRPQPTPGAIPGFEFDKLPDESRQKLVATLKGFSHVTTHLPFQGLSFISRPASTAEPAVRKMRHALEATKFFRAELAVLHVMKPLGMTREEGWPLILQQCRDWGDFAAQAGFRLAIETGFPPSVAEFVKLIKAIDHPNVGCAVDVGHQIRYAEFTSRVAEQDRSTPAGIRAYNDVMHNIIDQLGAKIFHFHVHDIDPAVWKEHKPIEFDVIDYPRLVKNLEAINYQGLLVLEIAAPDMRASLADNKRRLERFLAHD